MGIFDKAKDFARGNPDKADQIVDKAGDLVDERTGGQHAEHVDKAQDFARGQYGGDQQPTAPEGQQPPPPAPEGHIGEERPPV